MRVSIIWNTILFLIALVLIVKMIYCIIPHYEGTLDMFVPQGDPFISMHIKNER